MHAHENAIGLKERLPSPTSDDIFADRDVSVTTLQRERVRWEASAKRLAKQLKLRIQEVQDLEQKLAVVDSKSPSHDDTNERSSS